MHLRTNIIIFISLVIIWIGLMGLPNSLITFIFFIISTLSSFIIMRQINPFPQDFVLKPILLVNYIFWLIKEVIKSALAVVGIIWSKNLQLNSSLKWINTKQVNNIGLTFYGNSITITPGTVTIDVKDNLLLVHALDNSSIQDLQNSIMDEKIFKIFN